MATHMMMLFVWIMFHGFDCYHWNIFYDSIYEIVKVNIPILIYMRVMLHFVWTIQLHKFGYCVCLLVSKLGNYEWKLNIIYELNKNWPNKWCHTNYLTTPCNVQMKWTTSSHNWSTTKSLQDYIFFLHQQWLVNVSRLSYFIV